MPCTNSEAELVKRYEAHPLLVEDILSRDVRSDIASDRVSNVLGSVRVELTTGITVRDVDLGSVPESVDLNVLVGLDKLAISNNEQGSGFERRVSSRMRRVARSGVCAYVSGVDGSVRNQPGAIPGLCAVSHDDRLNVSNERVWAGFRRPVDAKVVDGVEGDETRVRGLVDNRTGLSDFGPLRKEIGRKGVPPRSAIKLWRTTTKSENQRRLTSGLVTPLGKVAVT